VLEVTKEVSMASEKLAETFVDVATPVAPSNGDVDETNGATRNVNADWEASYVPAVAVEPLSLTVATGMACEPTVLEEVVLNVTACALASVALLAQPLKLSSTELCGLFTVLPALTLIPELAGGVIVTLAGVPSFALQPP